MSDTRNDLKVGDGAYVFDTQRRERKCIVTKLGRKWLTVTTDGGDTFKFDRTDAFAGVSGCGYTPVLLTKEQLEFRKRLAVLSDNADRHREKLAGIRSAVTRGDLAQARVELRQAMAEYAIEIDQFAIEVPNDPHTARLV